MKNDRASERHGPEMYPASIRRATRDGVTHRTRLIRLAEGFMLGVGIWVLLLTLGVPWMFHLGAFDGMIPCAIAGAVLGWCNRRGVTVALGAALSVLLLIIAYTPIISG